MKNGLLVYQTNPYNNIFNIGDYIQSLAAAQFLPPKIEPYINREKLDEYNGEEVRLIMNGWFMHEPSHWPPSPKIHPLFVSFHLNVLAKSELLKDESINYLKKFEPIGCRDKNTVKLLTDNGVDAYFSGCLTLTLGESYKSAANTKRNGIYFTDVYNYFDKAPLQLIKTLIILLTNLRSILLLNKRMGLKISIKNILKAASFYRTYSKKFTFEVLTKANYIEQEIPDNFLSDEEKFSYAKDLLRKYSTAQFVVTSRIHCALPCLSLETPVIYIENINQTEESSCRLDGIRDLFHVMKCDKGKLTFDLTPDKINTNTTFKNKDEYNKLRIRLIDTCKLFTKR